MVEPLTPAHADDLFTAVGAGTEDEDHLWTYLGDSPYRSLEAFSDAVTAKEQSEDPLYFAVVDIRSEPPKAVGWAALMRIDAKSRVVEVGSILFTPALQRTTLATEAMYLMAKYVFEDLQYRRYEWKCDNLNAPSKRAALRFGFTFEGVFRQHMIYKGRTRDTAWFSMLDSEWYNVAKSAFERWLDPANFEPDGKQRKRLEEMRDQMDGQRGPVVLKV